MNEPDFDNEEYFYDTFDQIIDENELDYEEPNHEENSGMSSEHWGMTFALSEELAEEAKSEYDLDENTDIENFKQAMLQNHTSNKKDLPYFEQIIDDICKGNRSLFDYNY